jgi:hypothetical protein
LKLKNAIKVDKPSLKMIHQAKKNKMPVHSCQILITVNAQHSVTIDKALYTAAFTQDTKNTAISWGAFVGF